MATTLFAVFYKFNKLIFYFTTKVVIKQAQNLAEENQIWQLFT